jgi:hypothetical protein
MELRGINTYVEEFNISDELLNKEYLINEVPMVVLKSIFAATPNDPELYDSYEITEKEAAKINECLSSKIQFDFKQYGYLLQRYGDYVK